MPLLRVSALNAIRETDQNRANSQANSRENDDNFGPIFNKGCRECGSNIQGKPYVTVVNNGPFCSGICWNSYCRRKSEAYGLKDKIGNPIKQERLTDYRLRDDEEWLDELKQLHKTFESSDQKIARHPSVYICSCGYAKHFRASEIGMEKRTSEELGDII